MIGYYGGYTPKTQEEGMEQMNQWKEWISSLGETIVNPGTSLMHTHIVTSSNVVKETDPHSLKGYAIIKAEDLEEAIKISKSDPFLNNGGTIRVSQMIQMK